MSGEIAIKIEKVGKKYTIGRNRDSSLRGFLGNILNSASQKGEDFWALNDISLTINEGDVIGIVGKNGAGKSTLLKILSQITKPTTGRIEIIGRVASLLEVGTGFHPELTGRENIFLNGTILGMSRLEVKLRFDEIVDFSGIEKFLDTPVKHYSSGMYVRLAFAVAAHLEPEILIIDEVLAVGDASFQKRCLGKMEEVSRQGRTVIFVSHDMGAVASLCEMGVLLEDGRIKIIGEVENVLDLYMKSDSKGSKAIKYYDNSVASESDGTVKLVSIKLVNENKEQVNNIYVNQRAGVEIEFEVRNDEIDPIPNIHVFHGKGGKLFVTVNSGEKTTFSKIGSHRTIVWFPAHFFNDGFFSIGVAISTLDPVIVRAEDYDAISFEVLDVLDCPTRNGFTGKFDGYLRPLLEWENNVQ